MVIIEIVLDEIADMHICSPTKYICIQNVTDGACLGCIEPVINYG